MKNKLKPCPFCGNTNIKHQSHGPGGNYGATRWIRCDVPGGCGVTGGYVYDFEQDQGIPFTKETAEQRWNTRTNKESDK